MIAAPDLLTLLRPLHVWVAKSGQIWQAGGSIAKLAAGDLRGRRFLETFEILRPAHPASMRDLRDLSGLVVKLRLREEPDIGLRGMVIDDQDDGVIVDLSFGIAVVDAVGRFGLTARDFAASDLAIELLFLHEAKSSAMAASFSLNSRLDGARLAAETRALTDGLTGLHNRRALESTLNRLGYSETDYALLHIDLDHFKQVNDTMGHSVGDSVLRHVASLMRSRTRKDDVLIRTGGDEFVILCPGLTDTTRLRDLSQSLITDISAPLKAAGHEVRIGASIGIAISSDARNLSPGALIDCADVALYTAKRSGRGQYAFWSDDMGSRLSDLHLQEKQDTV